MHDLLLKNAHVVDPKNRINGIADIAIQHGKIAEVKLGIDSDLARRIFDLSGKVLMPGIIDPHVHVSGWIGRREGYKMMAKVGVVTAVDLAGPVEDIISGMSEKGAGLNIAVLHALVPGGNVSGENPSRHEIETCVQDALQRGAIGIKILGGHYPLTPDATAHAIHIANEHRAYVAFHAGTTESKSDLNGFKEAVTIIGAHPVHIAHINSYCRGTVKKPVDEIIEAFSLLEGKDHIVSESYLALINGTSGKCVQDEPESHITQNCLRIGGFAPTREGLYQAILNGFALVNVTRDGENVLVHGQEGADVWLKADTDTTISFEVNNPQVLFLCATYKDRNNNFLIDAFSTDGGGIPRNVTVEKGLVLVKFGALSIEEFVVKSSLNPSRMFGMVDKGHLGIGADADITVLDIERGKAVMGISGGHTIMIEGMVTGEKGTLLTTKQGKTHLQETGITYRDIDLNQSLLYA